jgi:hypothetical protein
VGSSANFAHVHAGDDLHIRHQISGLYIQFDDLQSPSLEPSQSCASMTRQVCANARLRAQYRVSVDAESRFLLSQSEVSIVAHANERYHLCPALRSSPGWVGPGSAGTCQ